MEKPIKTGLTTTYTPNNHRHIKMKTEKYSRFVKPLLMAMLVIIITGCGNRDNITVLYERLHDDRVVYSRPVKTTIAERTMRTWDGVQKPTLEVAWKRLSGKHHIEFSYVWVGEKSRDMNKRDLVGYFHSSKTYIGSTITGDNQFNLFVNLDQLPQKRQKSVNHITLKLHLDRELKEAVRKARADPTPDNLNSAAWLAATSSDQYNRNGELAVSLAIEANKASYWKDHNNLDTLAAAYAEKKDFANAIKYQEQALERLLHLINKPESYYRELAGGNEFIAMAMMMEKFGEQMVSGDQKSVQTRNGYTHRLELYRNNRPYRQE